MTIPLTAIQKRRLISQIESNLTGLQRDLPSNAMTHKAMAQDLAAANPWANATAYSVNTVVSDGAAYFRCRVAHTSPAAPVTFSAERTTNPTRWETYVTLAILQSYVADCAQSYLTRLQWIIDLRANPTRRQRLIDVLSTAGWVEQEIIDVVTALRNAAVALRDAPRTTLTQIIAACDAVTTSVDKPESLWPE